MQTECSAEPMLFARLDRRELVADFGGGAISADAGDSCRNRHCPKCQGHAREAWVAARRAELLPVPYFHVVFTLPAPVGAITLQNKATVYAILFRAAAETLRVIAADPRHLGAEIDRSLAQVEVINLLQRLGQRACGGSALIFRNKTSRLDKGIAPAAQIRCRNRKLPRDDLQWLAPQHPQHRLPLAPRRHAPLPARSRDRSDI